jgi:hypothetical protein
MHAPKLEDRGLLVQHALIAADVGGRHGRRQSRGEDIGRTKNGGVRASFRHVLIAVGSDLRELSSDRVQKLVPSGHHADGRFSKRVERHPPHATGVEQADIGRLAARESREVAAHKARHRDARAVVA